MARFIDYKTVLVDFILRQEGSLFHVTDKANLASIEEHGLLSKIEADIKGVVPIFPGGDGLTRALDMCSEHGGNSVFLGFHPSSLMPNHPGEGRRRRPVLLRINPEVLYRHDVRIALGRANHQHTKVYRVWYAVQQMDAGALQSSFTGSWDPKDFDDRARVRAVFSYEVLVPKVIPPEFILSAEEAA